MDNPFALHCILILHSVRIDSHRILRLERYLYSCATIFHWPFNLNCLFKFATNGVIGSPCGTSSREALQKNNNNGSLTQILYVMHEWTSLTGESKRKVRKVQIHLTLVTFIIHVHACTLCIPAASFIDERHPSA